MRVICTSVGKGHDQQPGTCRISFEDVLPPHATALTLTVPVEDAGKFSFNKQYIISLAEVPPVVVPAVKIDPELERVVAPSDTQEDPINAS